MKHIEAICRSFLWSNTEEITRRAPVAWDNVCNPMRADGLNITSLREWNTTTIVKLLWNIQSKAEKLWVKWVNIYYLKDTDVMEWQPNTTTSWLLESIVNCRNEVRHLSYWQEVMQRGKYKTVKMYDNLRGDRENMTLRHILTRNLARPRAIFITWLTLVGRLNTKDKLMKIGIETDNACVFCETQESLEHLFFECNGTGTVWKTILSWIGYNRQPKSWTVEYE